MLNPSLIASLLGLTINEYRLAPELKEWRQTPSDVFCPRRDSNPQPRTTGACWYPEGLPNIRFALLNQIELRGHRFNGA